MTTCSRWDIVLVPFPFTNLMANKKRPALVVSPDGYNRTSPDMVIGFITSRLDTPARHGDFRLRMWKESGLPKPSMLRMKFATVEQSIVIKRLGALHAAERVGVRNTLAAFFAEHIGR